MQLDLDLMERYDHVSAPMMGRHHDHDDGPTSRPLSFLHSGEDDV